jgi:uncharacterized protein YjbJ (UPF0337 family)
MNKDQVKGATRKVAGKVQKKAGKAVGSKKTEAKGLLRELAGAFQQGYGDGRASETRAGAKRRAARA